MSALFGWVVAVVIAGVWWWMWRRYAQDWRHLVRLLNEMSDGRTPTGFVFRHGGRFAQLTYSLEKLAAEQERDPVLVDGVPITRHWLIPENRKPKLFTNHPTLTLEEIRVRTQGAWDQFYSWRRIWARSAVVRSVRNRLAFLATTR